MNRLTEKVLFEKLQQGDQKVLKNFFDDTFALFVAFAQDFLGRDDACEDIVQDTFVTFWEQKESFENIYYVKAFFYKTLEGYSNGEIAEKLGISVNTVRTHKARAYQYLRGRLNELRILLLLLQPW